MMQIRLVDFTDCPGVDYIYTGPHSGEWFANLISSNLMGQPVLLDLDGTHGIHPNFLEGVIDTLLERRIDVDSIAIKSDEEPEYKEFWLSHVRYMKRRMENINFDVEHRQFWDRYFFYKTGQDRLQINNKTVRSTLDRHDERNENKS